MFDVVILGGGIIGLSIALALQQHGAGVAVLEREQALSGATTAAAGMLAVHDPHNPQELLPFSRFSRELYGPFLAMIEDLSGVVVPFQTDTTVQYLADGSTVRIEEQSLDPRQLAPALLAAVHATSVRVMEHTTTADVKSASSGLRITTSKGVHLQTSQLIHTAGAWLQQVTHRATDIVPRKGQMLRVRTDAAAPLTEVHRAEHIYVVPRTHGPQAGSALIGATIEDAGFDTTTSSAALQALREAAAALSPATAFVAQAPMLEAWAGLRPATRDGLPLIGQAGEREWIAAGHFRNGILLAPGTARLMTDLLQDRTPALDLAPFRPFR